MNKIINTLFSRLLAVLTANTLPSINTFAEPEDITPVAGGGIPTKNLTNTGESL